MGYTTDFSGKFDLDKPLTMPHFAFLKKFNKTRRMKRDAKKAAKLPDTTRADVELPVGDEGAYFVAGVGFMGQDKDASVVDGNKPPKGQPGLWCQWTPSENGKHIEWDGGEKFYDYVEWLNYIITHFLKPWGYVLNGRVTWQGEEHGDIGTIIVKDNVVNTVPGHVPVEKDAINKDEEFDEFLQDACMKLNDLWVQFGGTEMKSGELTALNDTLTAFFGDKRS